MEEILRERMKKQHCWFCIAQTNPCECWGFVTIEAKAGVRNTIGAQPGKWVYLKNNRNF